MIVVAISAVVVTAFYALFFGGLWLLSRLDREPPEPPRSNGIDRPVREFDPPTRPLPILIVAGALNAGNYRRYTR
ncbi:hypothetical protein [Nocardia brasiliensis]|uniref:hypothetical protein n=1 Tax=Nocardia brasiliensis TaxID=37326 RepID=UPI002458DB4C|nr:hypothetical protein [Nocardia brasiliensis]